MRAVDAGHLSGQFTFHDKKMLATIGRSSVVALVTGLPDLRGFPAWVIWIAVHIMHLLGYRNRLSTMVNLGAKDVYW